MQPCWLRNKCDLVFIIFVMVIIMRDTYTKYGLVAGIIVVKASCGLKDLIQDYIVSSNCGRLSPQPAT